MKNFVRRSVLPLLLAVTPMVGCGPSQGAPDMGESGDDLAELGAALVTQNQVPGIYNATLKRVRIKTCTAGGFCSVTTEERAASAVFTLNTDGTYSCTGADCFLTSGTWAFPPFGDWRYLSFSNGGAKVGEALLGVPSLTVYSGTTAPNITGVYVDYVYAVHR